MSPQFRRQVFQLHRWAGLSIGLVIVWMAITGAMMVFRTQLEPLVNRDLLVIEPCAGHVPLDRLTEAARIAHPAGKLDYIRVYGAEDAPSLIRFSDKETVYLNPCSGSVIGGQNRYGGLFGWIEKFHKWQFIDGGSLFIGTIVILFTILLIVGGLIVWWPSSFKALKGAVKLNPRATGRAKTLNRHRTIGLYAALILLVSALTGLPQAFDWYKNGIYRITGSAVPGHRPKVAAPVGGRFLPMETFWQHAQSLAPHPREALLHYPEKPDDPVEIYIIAQDAPHANARTYLFLNPYTDEVLRYTPYAESSLGHKVYFWSLSIHTALAGGIVGQLLLLAGALSVPYLAYTGIGSYLRRKFPARKAAARPVTLTPAAS